MKVFRQEELKKYDGSNGTSYVAYRGKVYDVSKSFQWKRGAHQFIHKAGQDLTDDSKDAPPPPQFALPPPRSGRTG